MTRTTWVKAAVCALFCLAGALPRAHAELTIEITQGVSDPIPIVPELFTAV